MLVYVDVDFSELDVYDLQQCCVELACACADCFDDLSCFCEASLPLFVKTFESSYNERILELTENHHG